MEKNIIETKKNELLKKKKYYREHPKEAKRAYFEKHIEDYGPTTIDVKDI